MALKKKARDFWESKKFEIIVLVIGSVALPSVSLYCDLNQNRKIENLDFKYKAEEFKPLLKPIGIPFVTNATFKSSGPIDAKPNGAGLIDVGSTLELGLKYKLVNDGNSVAKIRGKLICHGDCKLEQLRQAIVDPESGETSVEVIEDSSEYPEELAPTDTLILETHLVVDESNRNSFKVHFMAVYENPNGNVYDTYVGATGSVTDFLVALPPGKCDRVGSVQFSVKEKYCNEVVKFKRAYPSYYTYSKKEVDKMNR